jgi:hypothetical protein
MRMLANTSALLQVQPSLCLHETKKLPSLKHWNQPRKKNPNLTPCSPTPSPTLGTKNSNIPLASPKEKNWVCWVHAAMPLWLSSISILNRVHHLFWPRLMTRANCAAMVGILSWQFWSLPSSMIPLVVISQCILRSKYFVTLKGAFQSGTEFQRHYLVLNKMK